MVALRLVHRTAYSYRLPVLFNPHRMLLRPRESRDLRLLSMRLEVSPQAQLAWAEDVAGNVVATATFGAAGDRLVIESVAEIELDPVPWPVFDIAASAASWPFRYDDDDWTDLGALAAPQHPDPAGRLRDWARAFVLGERTDTLSLLKDLNAGIASGIAYEAREDEGTQAPLSTLERGRASCRDLAVLFAEAVRALGFGARIVSGYLHDPAGTLRGSADTGATHAWAEVYVPGAGWIAFDPTNGGVGAANLVPVAVGRDIGRVMPVSGSFAGPADALAGMQVDVSLEAGAHPPPAADGAAAALP